ncbi:hypothetical protein HC928_09400 [bacterium]|nr:hypothetical protein [bacterium]
MAYIRASDLLKMEGIADQSLFDWNVRQALGRTDVNKDIEKSVRSQDEHKNFVLYHNGLTVLCESLKFDKENLIINAYSVVNGCQSLTTLYQNQSYISDDLIILTRFIQVAPDSDLATKITNRTNNQKRD